MPEIDLALKEKIHWLKMTTPGASKEAKEKPKPMSSFIEMVKAMPGTKVYGG